jgi:hypothetical protein
MKAMSNVLTAAFSYPQRGFSVIPIQPSEKKPLVHWEQYQSGRATESLADFSPALASMRM